MENNQGPLLKMVLKNGHVIALYCEEEVLNELASHPKFIKMHDTANDIYVSIEDVSAFEILNNRKESPVEQEVEKPASE